MTSRFQFRYRLCLIANLTHPTEATNTRPAGPPACASPRAIALLRLPPQHSQVTRFLFPASVRSGGESLAFASKAFVEAPPSVPLPAPGAAELNFWNIPVHSLPLLSLQRSLLFGTEHSQIRWLKTNVGNPSRRDIGDSFPHRYVQTIVFIRSVNI